MMQPKKVIFIQDVKGMLEEGIAHLEKEIGYKLEPVVLIDTSDNNPNFPTATPDVFEKIEIDFNDTNKLASYIEKIREDILLVTCRTEASMMKYVQVMELLPDLPAPSRDAVETALSKSKTREHMQAIPEFSTGHVVVTGHDEDQLLMVEEKIGFPCIVKPTGLDSSLLVQKCNNREEVIEAITKIENKIHELYATLNGRGHTSIVVEEMIVGEMYSIDVFVAPNGEKYFCPLTRVITGADVGLDDFFGYIRRTPIEFEAEEMENAHKAAAASIDALGLKATTCHVELFHTKNGWKLIEIGPRTGGYRDQMHTLSVGLPYAYNDLAVRTTFAKPDVEQTKKGFSAVINLYPKHEGKLKESVNDDTLNQLKSHVYHRARYFEGEHISPAKFGGKPVLSVTLCHEDREVVEADLKTIENNILIETI